MKFLSWESVSPLNSWSETFFSTEESFLVKEFYMNIIIEIFDNHRCFWDIGQWFILSTFRCTFEFVNSYRTPIHGCVDGIVQEIEMFNTSARNGCLKEIECVEIRFFSTMNQKMWKLLGDVRDERKYLKITFLDEFASIIQEGQTSVVHWIQKSEPV